MKHAVWVGQTGHRPVFPPALATCCISISAPPLPRRAGRSGTSSLRTCRRPSGWPFLLCRSLSWPVLPWLFWPPTWKSAGCGPPCGGCPLLAVSFPAFSIGLLLIQLFSFTWHSPGHGQQRIQEPCAPGHHHRLPAADRLARSGPHPKPDRYLARALYRHRPSSWAAPDRPFPPRHAKRGTTHVDHLGVMVGYTVTEAVVVEKVFGRPGLGSAIQQAVQWQDVPTVQGVVLLAASPVRRRQSARRPRVSAPGSPHHPRPDQPVRSRAT